MTQAIPAPRRLLLLACLAASTTLLPACAPLLFGGAVVGGGMVAIDRRTTGAQVDDAAIEIKASSRIAALATLGHVNVTSYNRILLLTGEVPTAEDRARVEQTASLVENVRSVDDELAVMPNSSFGSRSNDTYITAKVKATFVDAKDLQAPAIKIVTERGIVYLMGLVTEREATRAADLAASVPGVKKVVRVFEIISEAELANLQAKPAPVREPASAPKP